jgi:hypothetical protein
VRLCSRVAVFRSTHSCNKINQTNSELKHGHNKVDDAVRKTLIRHGQSMRKHGTTAELPRTFKVKLLQMLKGRETTRHFLGYAWEIYVQWRLQKCRVTGRCDQSYDRKSCGDGAFELMFCC